jgi:glucose uptake protein
LFLPGSYAVALVMMLLGMFFWGSWPNAQKLTPGWRFELFQWDYVIGIFVTALLVAITFGSFGGSTETSWQNLIGADRSAWMYAIFAGIVWNIGNILLIAGVSMVGMAIAFPISIGLALVTGAIGSYLITPRGNAILFFSGVMLVFCAVLVSSMAYRSASSVRQAISKSGLWTCIISGLLFIGFGPLLAKALTAPHPLSPYGVNILFGFGALLSTLLVMPFFMKHPLEGLPITMALYRAGTFREHSAGWLAGFIWALGSTCAFVPMAKVGTALAYSIGQSSPMVAAIWGIFAWKEFKGAPRQSWIYLSLMFVLYISGLLLLTFSFDSTAA